MAISRSNWSFWISNLPILLAMLFMIVAIMLPAISLKRPVHRYQLTFDISQSMNVADVSINGVPVSRVTLAKAAAKRLLQKLPCGSRVGWSVFTGQRNLTLLKPLDVCKHYNGLIASLNLIDDRMRWFDGSSIGKGLHQSLRAAHAMQDNIAVVMISDGHEAPPLRPGQKGIPKKIKGLDVPGMLIGVGGDSPVPIPKTDTQGHVTGHWLAHEVMQQPGTTGRPGHEELSSLKYRHLMKLARLVDLNYARLQSPNDLVEQLKEAKLTQIAPSPVDFRWIPALLALICLCWRLLPTSRKNKPPSGVDNLINQRRSIRSVVTV